MNLKSKWWLLIGTILSQIWLPWATAKKNIALKQLLKKEEQLSENTRVKKVSLGNLNLVKYFCGRGHRYVYLRNKAIKIQIVLISEDDHVQAASLRRS